MLETFTLQTFEPLGGTAFRVHLDAGDVELTLFVVEALKSPGEAFSLQFRGPREPYLGQGTRDISHPELGRFLLFITPIGQEADAFLYEAVFNRLPGSRALAGAPPPAATA